MILLTVNEIISMHSKLIAKTGGTDGLRDFGLLESAVNSSNASYDDVEVYKTVEEKSARLAYSIVSNHAFVDGNKRIGILVMLATLRLNDAIIKYSRNELIDLGLSLADGKLKYEDVLDWIMKRM